MNTRRTFLQSSAVSVGAMLAGCSGLTKNMTQDSADRPVQAHRCFAADYPENTLLAAEEAAAGVADQLEIDVRRCGSGEIVVFHDERVDDKTDGSGAVADLSLSELRELHVLDSDQRVPTLRELYETVQSDVAINVELKEYDIVADVRAVVTTFNNRTVLSAIRPTIVQQADQVREDDEYEVAIVGVSDPARALETALAMHCDRIHFGYRVLVETNALQAAKDAGLWVNTGTLQSTSQYALAREMDVDGFSGDTAATFER